MLPKFNSILCLNGRLPDKTWFTLHKDLIIIAADGAGNNLIANNIVPNFIIGDLDSIEKKYLNCGADILHISNQDTTDFEKCLFAMQARNLFPSLILGITGGEIDHSIYNLNCFMQYAKNHSMYFLDVDENNKYKLGLPVFQHQTIYQQNGSMLSLMPFPEALISTTGLKWDLSNALLSVTGKASVRNLIIDNTVTISVNSGALLLLLAVTKGFC